MFYIISTVLLSSINLGVLGSVILWRRIVNIGDCLSHALIFSVLIEHSTGLNQTFGSLIVAILFVSLVHFFSQKENEDNLNMIIFSSTLVAISLLITDFTDSSFKIKNFVIGDALGAGQVDFIISFVVLVILLTSIYFIFHKIVLVCLSEEVAHVKGISVPFIKFAINIFLAITIAISIQIIGVLLMTTLLIIPPSIARNISSSPEQMVIFSVIASILSGALSILLSLYFDISFSPFFVITLFTLYISSFCYKKLI